MGGGASRGVAPAAAEDQVPEKTGEKTGEETQNEEYDNFVRTKTEFSQMKDKGLSNESIFSVLSSRTLRRYEEGKDERDITSQGRGEGGKEVGRRAGKGGSVMIVSSRAELQDIERGQQQQQQQQQQQLACSPQNRRVSAMTMKDFYCHAQKGVRTRREQIFLGGLDVKNVAEAKKVLSTLAPQDGQRQWGDDSAEVVRQALAKVLFVGASSGASTEEATQQMNGIFESLVECGRKKGEWLMREGGEGDHLYIIKSGTLEVLIAGERVRELKRGDCVGELALLCKAPRSASVRALEQCELWSLHRDKFRRLQAVSSYAALLQRIAWLNDIEALHSLDRRSLAKLASSFETVELADGQEFVRPGDCLVECYLVERGAVLATREGEGGDDSDGSSSWASVLATQSLGDDRDSSSAPSLRLEEGAFLGLPVLFSAASVPGGWEPLRGDGDDNDDDGGGGGVRFAGAKSPISLVAEGRTVVRFFTIATFEALVGRPSEVLTATEGTTIKHDVPFVLHEAKEDFVPSDFEQLLFLGTGSFGRVTLVTLSPDSKKGESLGGVTAFALKALSKVAILARQQLAHVKDEQLLLQNLSHPFILKLFATFQDSDSVFFLTENLSGGDLWSVIYEGSCGFSEGKLPIEYGRFYAASVLEPLAYMHSRNVAYRDLKPENIILDAQGYLRLIDLGFAKRIPWSTPAAASESSEQESPVLMDAHPKSFTMCGTPEYLAPEFIFNSGHDHSVDYWAFGCLVFELTAGYTPFQTPSDDPDMHALFKRIVSKEKHGLNWPTDYDEKAGSNSHSRNLVEALLQEDPLKRMGNLLRGPDDIRSHPFFQEISFPDLLARRLPAPFVPSEKMRAVPDDGNHLEVESYSGDQAIFQW